MLYQKRFNAKEYHTKSTLKSRVIQGNIFA